MKTMYVKLDEQNKVVRCDTNNIEGFVRVEMKDGLTFDKMMSCFYQDGELVFDEQHYKNRVKLRNEKSLLFKKRIEDENTLRKIEMKNRLSQLTDDEARQVSSLFDCYEKNACYNTGDRFLYDGVLYKANTDIDKNNTQLPSPTCDLYTIVQYDDVYLSCFNLKIGVFMVKTGKVKFDNNYWLKKPDGTWSNTWNFFEIIYQDFGTHNVVYVYNVGKVSLTSTDGGETFTQSELSNDIFTNSDPVYINIPESEIDALVRKKLNPMNQNKIITWEEPMHEIAQ